MSVFLLLLYIILGLPVLILFYWEWINYTQITRRLPGPRPLPFVGNAHQVGKTSHEILANIFKWWNEYGKVNFRFTIGITPNIVVCEVKDMEFVLSSNTMIQKSDLYDLTHPWLGNGLLTSYGTYWRKHRKMITPSFHFSILQDFHEIMNRNSNKFIKQLRAKSANEQIIDIQEISSFLTLDVICETAMGIEINAVENPDSELVVAFRDMGENLNTRAFHPIKRNQTLYKLAPDYKDYCRILNTLKSFTNQVIDTRMNAMKNEVNEQEQNTNEFGRRKKAFLDNLLTSTIDGKPLTKQEVYDEVSTFIFEGFDTTTSGVSFAMYLLSRHPEIQRRVLEEQKTIFGEDMKRDASFQEISEMKYLDLVLKEVERLYPSVPLIARAADKDYDMNGTIIPKGTSVILFLMAMGYREEVFKDPYRCDPSRFENLTAANNFNAYSYVPFSAGPRNCIGQKFALLELKTIVSKMVRNFEILPPLDELVSKNGLVQHFYGMAQDEAKRIYTPSKYDPQLSLALTLKSTNGVLIRLRERN